MEDGSRVERYSDGSTYVEFTDGTSKYTDPYGETSRTVAIGEGDTSGWITQFDDGSSYTVYDNGRESFTDPSGFSVEILIDPETGVRTETSSDGTIRREDPDGSFSVIYPDGSRDIGTVNPDGDLVVTFADGSNLMVRDDGSETYQDPYGVTTIVTLDAEGREPKFPAMAGLQRPLQMDQLFVLRLLTDTWKIRSFHRTVPMSLPEATGHQFVTMPKLSKLLLLAHLE